MSDLAAYTSTPLGEIDTIYDQLQNTFASHKTQSIDYRIYNLQQLAYLIKDNELQICNALKADLDKGAFDIALTETWLVLGEINLALKRLKGWMKDETTMWDAVLGLKFFYARVRKQPKGVALNFPWQLTLGPLVGAIAAGCPAMIKHSPATSALMASLIPKYLDPEGYAVVLGEVECTTKLLEKPWGHILFTGSGNVGKIVASAAAKTLTPTTLEVSLSASPCMAAKSDWFASKQLGGKSPVIVSECADLRITARRLLSIKLMNIGQMCVSPDYVLVVRSKVDEFVSECKKTLDEFLPHSPSPHSVLESEMATAFINEAGLQRHQRMLEQVEKAGQLVYRGELDATRRRAGISLALVGAEDKGMIVEEEIFGPIIPIIPVESVQAAIDYVNARPHALALHVCSSKKSVFNEVVKQTLSGSATWNDFAFATASRHLPFGGVGESGWGAYHGKAGFETFTHRRSLLDIPLFAEPIMSLRYPPMSIFGKRVYAFLLENKVSFSRPRSVEDVARKRKHWRLFRMVSWVVILLAAGSYSVFGVRK
ncbi:hypothetical protein P7C73_g451, partial [Tremellales sp. Uapishka_1]